MEEHELRISRRTFLGGAAALGIASLAKPLTAFATPTAAEKQAEADAVRIQVDSLKAELDARLDEYRVALDEHDVAQAAMVQAQLEIDETNLKIDDIQGKLGTRARSMYRGGGISFLDILFGASSFAEFATNWDILAKMNQDDADMIEESKILREELQASYDEYAKQEQIAAERMEAARVAKEETEAAANHYEAILASLDAETRELIFQEQEAVAVAAAAQAISQQENGAVAGNQGGGQPGGQSNGGGQSSGGGYTGGSAADFGPPAGDILSEAIKYIAKVPYVPGGNSPEQGFDCSGLVCYCCARVGRSVPPRSTYGYPNSGWFPVSEAQPGDILWQPNHVGICAAPGGTSYVHAANSQYGICYGSSPQFTRAYRY